MSSVLTVYRNNDNLVQNPTPMTLSSDGSYVNDATVTMTLKDSGGTPVSGASSLSLTYVTGSNGRYQGTLPYTLTLTAGAEYTLEITGTSGSGARAFWVLEVDVVNRSR
jgi:hypothetical protein